MKKILFVATFLSLLFFCVSVQAAPAFEIELNPKEVNIEYSKTREYSGTAGWKIEKLYKNPYGITLPWYSFYVFYRTEKGEHGTPSILNSIAKNLK